MKEYVDYEETFRKLIEKHKNDPDYDVIKDYPKIFSTITQIFCDRAADGFVKGLMNAAITYFVLPEDVISEKEHGIKGYVDDFFLCIHALRELISYDKQLGEYLIKKHWLFEDNYKEYIEKKYYKLISRLDESLMSEILQFSGIRFMQDLITSKKTPRTYYEKKVKDLQHKIDYMFYLFIKKPLVGREERKLFEKQVFGTENFKEFSKKITLLARKDKSFKRAEETINEILDLDEMIKKKKIERIMK